MQMKRKQVQFEGRRMHMKMTSAYANKMLKQLAEDKSYWVNKENDSCLYSAAVGETPVIPEYDFAGVSATIEKIDEKTRILKHAINLANVTGEVDVNGSRMTIDVILIAMAQLNKRKGFLDSLRRQQPQSRKSAGFYSSRAVQPEYQYINYDLDLAKSEYERVSKEIMDMQMALDKYNQTVEFEAAV